MGWNGQDLVDEFSALHSNTSATFEARVLNWINEIQRDICASYSWHFLRRKGQKVLTASTEEQSLLMSTPGAPTAAIASGGSLTEDSTYAVAVTYVDSNGCETQIGATSGTVTATAVNKTVSISSIPTSSDPLVTARNVYVSKDGGAWTYDQQIADNTTTTATITTETSSTVTPPDFDYIAKVDGELFFESGPNVQLRHKPLDQMRRVYEGAFADGTPQFYDMLTLDKAVIYPRPSSANTISFYFYKVPLDVFNVATSYPTLPITFKPLLRAGVEALGYEYKDKSGQVGKRNRYEELKPWYYSKYGQGRKGVGRVRDVMGDADGWEVN